MGSVIVGPNGRRSTVGRPPPFRAFPPSGPAALPSGVSFALSFALPSAVSFAVSFAERGAGEPGSALRGRGAWGVPASRLAENRGVRASGAATGKRLGSCWRAAVKLAGGGGVSPDLRSAVRADTGGAGQRSR
ncbi:hypothetical protein J3R03_005205 [Actinoplanes couchii]|nr:hypothetical protein [Actinoplanes couchii]